MISFEDIRLADLSQVVTVSRGFPTQRAAQEGEVRVMSLAALRSETPPRHFADRDDIRDVGLEPAQPGDVLVAVEGGTVGETLVVPDGTAEFVPSQQVATLRVVDATSVDPWYLGAWLTTASAREQIRRLARGTAIQRVPIKDLASLIVRLPPFADQQAIGARFLAFENSIHSHRAVATCLEELRDLDLLVALAAPGGGDT
jgi:restriction endonuclease S subunit